MAKDLSKESVVGTAPFCYRTEEICGVFNSFDQDDDGCIQGSEVGKAMKAYGMKQSKVQNILADTRIKANSSVTFQQFQTLISKHDAEESEKKTDSDSDSDSDMEVLRKGFKEFDLNGDGVLSRMEVRKMLTSLGENLTKHQLDELLAKVDENGDGKLDFQEFKKLMEDA